MGLRQFEQTDYSSALLSAAHISQDGAKRRHDSLYSGFKDVQADKQALRPCSIQHLRYLLDAFFIAYFLIPKVPYTT